MAFVCANDIASGFIIIILSMPLRDVVSVYLCGLSQLILNMLVCMALGNIFFICLQRYIFARHIISVTLKWKALLSKTLLTANLIIGAVVITIDLAVASFIEEFRAPVCTLAVFRNYGEQCMLMLLIIGLPAIVASDILCFLAILTLSRPGTVGPTEGPTNSSRSSDTYDFPDNRNFRSHQQGAIVTVLLILFAFNISTIPYFVTSTLGYYGMRFSVQIRRLMLFCIFLNSLANPLIYITRMQGLRSMFISDFVSLKSQIFRQR